MPTYKLFQFKTMRTLILLNLFMPNILLAMEDENIISLKPSLQMKTPFDDRLIVDVYQPNNQRDGIERLDYEQLKGECLKKQNNICPMYRVRIEDKNYAFAFRDNYGNLYYHDVENFVYWLMNNSRIISKNGRDENVWMHPYFNDEALEPFETRRVLIYYHTRKLKKPSYFELKELFEKFLDSEIRLPSTPDLQKSENIPEDQKDALLLERYVNFEFLDTYFSGTTNNFAPDRKGYETIAANLLRDETERAWLFRPSTYAPVPMCHLEHKKDADGNLVDYRPNFEGELVDAEGRVLPHDIFIFFKTISYKKTKDNPYQNVLKLETNQTKLETSHSRLGWALGHPYCEVSNEVAEEFELARMGNYSRLTKCFASVPEFLALLLRTNRITGFKKRVADKNDYERL